MSTDDAHNGRSTRVLVVLPSWIGDAVMATPALGLLREALPGALLGGLCRRGVDEVLAGSGLLDETHQFPSGGLKAPKIAAARVRLRQYASAVLLPNSFSSALAVRLAGVPRRWGYERDGRGLLLTDRLKAPKRREVAPFSRSMTAPDEWAPVPACDYYLRLVRAFLVSVAPEAAGAPAPAMRLGVTGKEERAWGALRDATGLGAAPFAVLNPGGNNPAKRWPAERFGEVAAWLVRERGLRVLLNGSPGEIDVLGEVSRAARAALGDAEDGAEDGRIVSIPEAAERVGGMRLGTLKPLLRDASLLVTNDTGPRHIAAAMRTPVVTMFGPTDARWTTITQHLPTRTGTSTAPEVEILADPSLPEEEVANDHPQRCAVDRIEIERVLEASAAMLDAFGVKEHGAGLPTREPLP